MYVCMYVCITLYLFENAVIPSVSQMNSTHAHFNISAHEIGAKLKPHGSVCPPFWIVTVEWPGARSCLFWWRHRFQIASFSPSTLENSVFKKHRFQIAPLWRAFSNGSGFGDRFRRCSVNNSRIWSKIAPFSFEKGLLWTGPEFTCLGQRRLKKKLCLTYKSRGALKAFTLFLNVKISTELTLVQGDKFEVKL